jgi:hypothetical protein
VSNPEAGFASLTLYKAFVRVLPGNNFSTVPVCEGIPL